MDLIPFDNSHRIGGLDKQEKQARVNEEINRHVEETEGPSPEGDKVETSTARTRKVDEVPQPSDLNSEIGRVKNYVLAHPNTALNAQAGQGGQAFLKGLFN